MKFYNDFRPLAISVNCPACCKPIIESFRGLLLSWNQFVGMILAFGATIRSGFYYQINGDVTNLVNTHPDLTCIVELKKGKFYFATLSSLKKEPAKRPNIIFLTIDNDLFYRNFFEDFGPLNLGCLYRYCSLVNEKFDLIGKSKCIVHYTSPNDKKRTNAAFLAICYTVLYMKKSPANAYKMFETRRDIPLVPFNDASMQPSTHRIHLSDCVNAVYKASTLGFFNFDDFDIEEYERYEQVRHGDINWILPRKLIGFKGPSMEFGSNVFHPPEHYIEYFQENNLRAVVRLNRKTYDAQRFIEAGIQHYDLYLPDGSVPTPKILNRFLEIAENVDGSIAVHCKAGLGRTGCLIAAYLVKHYKMTAREAIAWTRICRPGSVIGHQQTWLEKMEGRLWEAGRQYRREHYGDSSAMLHHKRGIYSISDKMERQTQRSSSIHTPEIDRHALDRRDTHTQQTGTEDDLTNKKGMWRILGICIRCSENVIR